MISTRTSRHPEPSEAERRLLEMARHITTLSAQPGAVPSALRALAEAYAPDGALPGALFAAWVTIKKKGLPQAAPFMSTELTREQALPLLAATLPPVQAQILSREYACKVSPSMFYASTGLGDGTRPVLT